ncbi:MAG TPA: alkaline phosphatase family protein [Candidatus Omnitrophota bacterium]|nr:alkaline phosphatase family protein [Candidatus Omnitrophota bacterium]
MISLLSLTPGTAHASQKVLFIGIDGASWDVVNPLIESGELPNFKKLIEHGVAGQTATESFWSQEIWVSMLTGKSAEEHGMRGFVNVIDGRLVLMCSSQQRKVPALWNLLSDHGVKSAFIAFLGSWPIEKIDGYMLSQWALPWYFLKKYMPDLLFNFTDEKKLIFPADYSKKIDAMFTPNYFKLREEMSKNGFPLNLPADRVKKYRDDMQNDIREMASKVIKKNKLSPFQPALNIPFLVIDAGLLPPIIYAITKYPFEIAKEIISNDPQVEFLSLYLGGPDILEHLYFPVDNSSPAKVKTIANIYKYIDKKIGEMFPLLSEDWVILVASDHGISAWKTGKTENGPIHTKENAIFIISGKNIREKQNLSQKINILDIFYLLKHLAGLDDSFPNQHKRISDEIFKS